MVRNRIRLLMVVATLPFLVLLGRLCALQLFSGGSDGSNLGTLERRNRTEFLTPKRGRILDARGRVLAQDVTSFDLEFTLRELHPRERFLPEVEHGLGICDRRCFPPVADFGSEETGGAGSGSGRQQDGKGRARLESCRGDVLEEQIRIQFAAVIALRDHEGGDREAIAGVVLVTRIEDAHLHAVIANLHRSFKLPNSKVLSYLESETGLYFTRSGSARNQSGAHADPSTVATWELRAHADRLLQLERTLQRVAKVTGRPYEVLENRVYGGPRGYDDEKGRVTGESPTLAAVRGARNVTGRVASRSLSVPLLREIDPSAVQEIVYEPALFPGINIVEGRRRDYPQGETAAALVGYLRPPSQRERDRGLLLDGPHPPDCQSESVKDPPPCKSQIEFILDGEFQRLAHIGCLNGPEAYGAMGVEEYYDALLRGAHGVTVEEVDSRGVPRQTLTHLEPVPGRDLTVSIDSRLQHLIYRELEKVVIPARRSVGTDSSGRQHLIHRELEKAVIPEGEARGASVVVMDLTGQKAPDGTSRPGALLASCGVPGFDPRRLMRDSGYFPEIEEREAEHHQGILLDRTLQVFETPGSVFKLVVAAAAMESGVVFDEPGHRARLEPLSPETRFACTHVLKVGGRTMKCLGNGHNQLAGEVNLIQALQYSCNIFFYHVGRERLEAPGLAMWASVLGFGRATDIDLGVGVPHRVFGTPAGHLATGRVSSAEMCSYAIGHQNYVRASSMQVLRAVAGIALGGVVLPHPFVATSRPPEKLGLSHATVRVLKEGMRRVVHVQGGPARDDDPFEELREYSVAVKTGTGEIRDGDPDSLDPERRPINMLWMAGYAPLENPEIAFVIEVEHAPGRGSSCARVLAPILASLAESNPRLRQAAAGPKSPRPSVPARSEPGVADPNEEEER